MTLYDVHLYREMRLLFEEIEAATPQEAAQIARNRSSQEADVIDECHGDDFRALVEFVEPSPYRSVMIDFTPDPRRKAALQVLEALQEALNEIEYHHGDMLAAAERNHPRGSGWARVYDKGREAIALAEKNCRL